MSINLVKGQRVEIELSKLIVELGWKVNPNVVPRYDLDVSTFLLQSNEEIEKEEDFVFYGSSNFIDTPMGKRPISADGSVLGSVDDLGDDDSGEGNEEIEIDLSKTSPYVQQILFTASIYWEVGSPSAKYNFGQVHNAYILIKNAETNEEILRYDLDEDFSSEKGVEFGRLYRRNGKWKFEAIGVGYTDGLEPICRKYASRFM